MNTRIALSMLTTLALTNAAAHAQIATFTYVGQEKAGPSYMPGIHAADQYDAGLAAQPVFSLAPDIQHNGTVYGANNNTFCYAVDSNSLNDLAAAKAGNAYLTFTVQASSGNVLDLTSFTTGVYGQEPKAYTFYLLSSVDNFATPIFTYSPPIATYDAQGTFAADLSGAAYQNLSGPVEFRLYTSGANTYDDTRGAANSTVLNGSVSVVPAPEPLGYVGLLAGAVGIGGLAVHRRSASRIA